MRRYLIFFIIVCGICIYGLMALVDDDAARIHPFIHSDKTCIECHNKVSVKAQMNNTSYICSQQCQVCHTDNSSHHQINVKMGEKLSENIILSSKKRMMCVTCHDPGRARYDNSVWKAESLYEKVFGSGGKFKTYFLIKKNNEGQLCKICH